MHTQTWRGCLWVLDNVFEKSEASKQKLNANHRQEHLNREYCSSIQLKDLFLITGDIIYIFILIFSFLHRIILHPSDQTMTCYELWDFRILDNGHKIDISFDSEGWILKYFSMKWTSMPDPFNYV